jgi:hypothetical protein
MVDWWWAPLALVGVIGLAILVGGLGGLFRGKLLTGGLRIIGGGAFVAVAVGAAMLGIDLQTYRRLTYEAPVAVIETHQKGPRLYDATLSEPAAGGAARTYELHGDEWEVDARVLKFRPWANVIGLNTQYRLERLSGRYQDVESELAAPRSAYDLAPRPGGGLDFWRLGRRYGHSVVDTLYGSGAYMPMADGARYEVWITQNGLLARPINAAANTASGSGWR